MKTPVCYNLTTYVGTPMLEVIAEPIGVRAYFQKRRISPQWFQWKGRLYRVEEVRNRWVTPEGLGRCYHFAVTVKDRTDLFELYLRSETMEWFLGSIDVDS
jgi:hypothetical protein